MPVPAYICRTCGVEHAPADKPPARCAICEDERQYVGWSGQRWTTMPELLKEGYRNEMREEEPGLTGIGIRPAFSIGQRALLVQTPGGNILYDCVSLLDEATAEAVQALGGIAAITLSHPHFYDAMVSWSRAFGASEAASSSALDFSMCCKILILRFVASTPMTAFLRC